MEESEKKNVCIMKVVSGPLSGCELMLTVNAHIIIIGQDKTYQTHMDALGFTTINIPSSQDNYELAITSEQNDDELSENKHPNLYVTLKNEYNTSKLPISFQEVMFPEQFPIVIKMLNDPWYSENKSIEATQAIKLEKTGRTKKKQIYRYLPRRIMYFATALVFIIFLGWKFHTKSTTNSKDIDYTNNLKRMHTLHQILVNSSNPLTIATDVNGQSLVLAKSQRDVDWSQQRLLNENYEEPVVVKMMSVFENEVEQLLNEELNGFLKIDLTQPCQPIIRQLKEYETSFDKTRINSTLKHFLNCSFQSRTITLTREDLLKKAEQGLIESDVPWKSITKNDKTTYIINATTDKQAISTMAFIEKFKNEWGQNYVKFSVSLTPNQLTAGRSFIINSDGHLLLDGNHWYLN